MPKYPDISVKLIGEDSNAYFILGRVTNSLKKAGHKDAAKSYMEEATSADYDHLLCVTAKYICIE